MGKWYNKYMKSTALFIDGENFIAKVEKVIEEEGLSFKKVDITKIRINELMQSVFKDLTIHESRFYSAKLRVHPETKEKSLYLINKQRALKTTLEKEGLSFVIAGNVRGQHVTVDGVTKLVFKEKGVDVKMAVDMVSMCCDGELDTAIICSSDSDLQPAITELKKRGVTVIYLGFGMSPNKGLTYSTDRTVLFRNTEIVEAVKKSV